jgi:hypothetical protein
MSDQAIYQYEPHARTRSTVAETQRGPSPVPPPPRHAVGRFNAWLAVRVTRGVGTMWCAYAFVALACVSLPSAVQAHNSVVLVSWISQTFLQLVLLSVVIVGQNVLAAASDLRSEATHRDAEAVLHETVKLQEHLQAQDDLLQALLAKVASLEAKPAG